MTDSGGTGATPADPLQVSLASPTSGPLSIGEASADGATSNGYALLGQVLAGQTPKLEGTQLKFG